MSGPDRGAVVVAGGYSRRFGDEEKALAVIDDTPLLRRVVRSVEAYVDELVINCRCDQQSDFAKIFDEITLDLELRFATDPVPDRGPVAGMANGLQETNSPHVLILACDLPFLEESIIRRIFETAAGTNRTAVPMVDDRSQPLCAVYQRHSALTACRAALDQNDTRVCGVVERLNPVYIETAHHRPFRDVDTQKDLIRARRMVEY